MRPLPLLLLIVFGCGSNVDHAPLRVYYWEIADMANREYSTEDIDWIVSEIPKYKYAITYTSGVSWPFYEPYDLDHPVPKQDLMPPHVHVHQYLPFSEYDPADQDVIKVNIAYSIDSLNQPIVSVMMEKRADDGWKKLVDTGSHVVLAKHFNSPSERRKRTLETILRNSFK
ncbi:MAG: hypothetical protein JXQ90_12195 [Cyclobacteriaceae bacterium]